LSGSSIFEQLRADHSALEEFAGVRFPHPDQTRIIAVANQMCGHLVGRVTDVHTAVNRPDGSVWAAHISLLYQSYEPTCFGGTSSANADNLLRRCTWQRHVKRWEGKSALVFMHDNISFVVFMW